jgi:DNA-binding MarR family transcriptional regulator
MMAARIEFQPVMPPSLNSSRPADRVPQDAEPSGKMSALDIADLHGHVGYFIRRLQVAIFKNFIETLAPMKVRPAQYSVLVVIAANPGSSQAAVGQALGIERARLARMLHEFERRKWVERRSRDGRSHALHLTVAGQKAFKAINALAANHEAQMAQVIGQKRRGRLLELLKEFG